MHFLIGTRPLKSNSMLDNDDNDIARLFAGFDPPLLHIFRVGLWLLTWAALSLIQSRAAAQGPPANFDQLTAKAADARNHGDTLDAIELYEAALQLNPKWPDGWWYVGSMQYGMNAYGPAAEALTHYIDLNPGAGPAFALRGLCEFEENKNSESLEDLQRGISLGAANQPKNAAIILYHEALLLTEIGRFEEALGQFTTMAKHGALNEDIIIGIGLASLRLPILPQAIQPAQINEISMVGQAASDVMNGNLTLAHSAFLEIFQRYPTTANLHYLYGYLLFTADPDQAIAQFRDELIVSPSSATAHAMLAWAYGLRGDYPQALPNAQKAVTEDPSLPLAQLVLGRSMIETGEAADGVPHLQIVLATEPQNLEAHLALAKAYSKLGQVEKARRERLVCLGLSGQGSPNASL